MKKILLGLILSILFLLVAVYLFIPGKLKIAETITIKAPLPAVYRVLSDSNGWNKWWPGSTPFIYNGERYRPHGYLYNTIGIDIYSGENKIDSRLEFVLVETDSMILDWKAEQLTSGNPFKRFSIYRQAKQTQENMRLILDRVKAFMEKTENIYGFDIRETKVADSVLVTTRRSFDHEPETKEITDMIQSLRTFISINKAVEKNFPMLNVERIDSNHFEAMTAIPVDRELPNTNEFVSKFLLKGGNILEGEVKGGPKTIGKAFNELENYRSDYNYKSPAIPYQQLITDRAKEPDTTKWITKLYYPIY